MRKTGSDGFGISAIARNLALGTREVAAIVGIATQELKGETRALKAIEAFDGLWRAPVLGGHGASSLLLFVLPKEGHTTIRKVGSTD
ncbi:hypothetical protein ABIA41_002620 [Bradyrhizobium sp. USDA 313]